VAVYLSLVIVGHSVACALAYRRKRGGEIAKEEKRDMGRGQRNDMSGVEGSLLLHRVAIHICLFFVHTYHVLTFEKNAAASTKAPRKRLRRVCICMYIRL
jgi:hypothetical protein